ncbi:MAG: molybdopterin-dependent oxidoreductase [Archangiaceae bacterium]|nr:molybdopterin-dependent oxidoreductase [Archangiaceae bacterium]
MDARRGVLGAPRPAPDEDALQVGLSTDGLIDAVDSKILIDGGAYSSFGLVTAYYSGQLLTGPYRFGSYHFDSTRVFTNKPPCGPKRGHGSVQPRFAFEVALDMAAEKLGLDPIEVRRKNFIGEDTQTINGQHITSNGFLQCLEAVEKASGWRERKGKLGFGRGLGVAGSMYISGTAYPIYPNELPQSGVQVKLDRSGKVTLFSGGSTSVRAPTRCPRTSSPKRSAATRATAPWWPPTPISRRSTWARIRAAAPS